MKNLKTEMMTWELKKKHLKNHITKLLKLKAYLKYEYFIRT